MGVKKLEEIDINKADTEIDLLRIELELKRIELTNDLKNAKKPSISGLWVPVLAASAAAAISAWSAWSVAEMQQEMSKQEHSLTGRLGELEIELGNSRLEHEKTESDLRRAEKLALRKEEKTQREKIDQRTALQFEANIVSAERPIILEALSIENKSKQRNQICKLIESGMFSSDSAITFFSEFSSAFDCETMQVIENGNIVKNQGTETTSDLEVGTVEWCRDKRSVAEAVRNISGKGTRITKAQLELRSNEKLVFISEMPKHSQSIRGGTYPVGKVDIKKVESDDSIYYTANFAARGRKSSWPLMTQTFGMSVRLSAYQYPPECLNHAEIFQSELPE